LTLCADHPAPEALMFLVETLMLANVGMELFYNSIPSDEMMIKLFSSLAVHLLEVLL
jgi:hypothetical protein